MREKERESRLEVKGTSSKSVSRDTEQWRYWISENETGENRRSFRALHHNE